VGDFKNTKEKKYLKIFKYFIIAFSFFIFLKIIRGMPAANNLKKDFITNIF